MQHFRRCQLNMVLSGINMTKFPLRYTKKGFRLPKKEKNYNFAIEVESNPHAA